MHGVQIPERDAKTGRELALEGLRQRDGPHICAQYAAPRRIQDHVIALPTLG
jgi:hypothetical protein